MKKCCHFFQSPQTIQNTMFGMPGTLGHMQVQPQPQSNIQQPQASLPNTASSTEINLLMTEGKLHHSELKTDLSRILDKVDSLQAKVVSLETSNQQLALQQAPDMEASIIMQNITRIMKVCYSLVFKFETYILFCLQTINFEFLVMRPVNKVSFSKFFFDHVSLP